MSYCDNGVLLLKMGKVPIYNKRAVGGVELKISAQALHIISNTELKLL
jgi:hypothetical protein